MIQPLSIPSPPPEWQVFNLGQWLRDIGLTWFGFDVNIYAYALCILAGIVVAGAIASIPSCPGEAMLAGLVTAYARKMTVLPETAR